MGGRIYEADRRAGCLSWGFCEIRMRQADVSQLAGVCAMQRGGRGTRPNDEREDGTEERRADVVVEHLGRPLEELEGAGAVAA